VANLLCIGAGYVGGPTMAVIAQKCPEHRVVVVDIDGAKIIAWQSDRLPIYEPGLKEVVLSCRDKISSFPRGGASHRRSRHHLRQCQHAYQNLRAGSGKSRRPAVLGKNGAANPATFRTPKIVVEKSTLPVRTAEAMEQILHSDDRDLPFDVVSNPEFLSEGTAIRNMENPDGC